MESCWLLWKRFQARQVSSPGHSGLPRLLAELLLDWASVQGVFATLCNGKRPAGPSRRRQQSGLKVCQDWWPNVHSELQSAEDISADFWRQIHLSSLALAGKKEAHF